MSGNALSKFRDSQGSAKPARSKSVLQQALEDYWARQGRMAQDGLQMAEQGADSVRAGNMSGLGGALLGPVAYLSSPINALFPERSEVDAAGDVPDWSKPFIAGGLETAAAFLPGPKTRGLGKGLGQLADDATDAERAALAARLETEAMQTGTGAVPASRDQALRNLTEVPEVAPWLKPNPAANYREASALRLQIEPLETQLKAALQSKNEAKAMALRDKIKAVRGRIAQLDPTDPALSGSATDDILRQFPDDE